MSVNLWRYEKVPVRGALQVVQDNLPNWRVEVWKVTSGDSGETYYIQSMYCHKVPPTGELATIYKCTIYLCNCESAIMRGQNMQSISAGILQVGNGCKHVEHLKLYLKERKQ